MVAASSASYIFPVLGVILSNFLYFSPLPAILRAHRTGVLGSLNPLPQALMVVSTNAWMCYGLAVPNGFIVASNLPGAVGAVAFVSITLPLIPSGGNRKQVQMVLVLGAAAALLLWTYLIFSGMDHTTRCFWLGTYGSAICVLLFASPLSTLREVLTSANAESIYAPLTLAQCMSAPRARGPTTRPARRRTAQPPPDAPRVLVLRLRHVDGLRPRHRRHLGVGPKLDGAGPRAGAAHLEGGLPVAPKALRGAAQLSRQGVVQRRRRRWRGESSVNSMFSMTVVVTVIRDHRPLRCVT